MGPTVTKKRKSLPLFGAPQYNPIDFTKNPEIVRNDDIEEIEDTTISMPVDQKQPVNPKQALINFFEHRKAGIEWYMYQDNNFCTIEIIWADEPTLWQLMEDLQKLDNNSPLHCHLSPRTFRFEVFVDIDN